MTEKKYLKKLRNLLSQVYLYSQHSIGKTNIEIIKETAIYWRLVREQNGTTGQNYNSSTIYIDLYDIILQYKIPGIIIDNIYKEEKIKISSPHTNFNSQSPIIRRDNKGIHIGNCGSNCNKVRYPKKNRSLATWKKFYDMFLYYAEKDNWNGKTSNKMK